MHHHEHEKANRNKRGDIERGEARRYSECKTNRYRALDPIVTAGKGE